MKTLLLAVMTTAALGAADLNVVDFGAKGDGAAVDTAAIQKALDAAAKQGATVIFRKGVYRSGALFLAGGVSMRVDEGVTIVGVQDLAAYPIMATRVAGIEMQWPAALINVCGQSKVRIYGKGVIDGDGKVWWDKYWKMRKEEYEPKGIRWAVDYDCQRPRLMQVFNSRDVSIENLTLKRSGFWTVHICYSDRVHIDGVVIRNNEGGHGPSTDGIDLDSSTNVLVERCDIDCNDDAFCLKAGRDSDGLRVNRPSEHIVIRNSIVRGGAAGITFGSETSGSIGHVEVYGMKVMPGVPNGILFKSASTRGGTIHDIEIRDFDMQGVKAVVSVAFNWNPSYSYASIPESIKEYPAYWKVLSARVPPEKGLPHLRNVVITNIKARGSKQALSVNSYKDSPLENFSFDKIDIEAETAGAIQNAANWKFAGTVIRTGDQSKVAVKDSVNVTGLPH